MIQGLVLAALAMLANAPVDASLSDDVKIVIECPLSATDGVQHKILLGFGQEYISKVDASSAKLLDPDGILNGARAISVDIDEQMPAGSNHAVTFEGGRKLSLRAIETGAFNAELRRETDANLTYDGRCFMIDGPIASYVFDRRRRGDWGKK